MHCSFDDWLAGAGRWLLDANHTNRPAGSPRPRRATVIPLSLASVTQGVGVPVSSSYSCSAPMGWLPGQTLALLAKSSSCDGPRVVLLGYGLGLIFSHPTMMSGQTCAPQRKAVPAI
jgi:hypothetical protein